MNRKRAILATLLAIFACSLVYSFLRMPRQERVEKLKYQPGMTAQPVKPALTMDGDPSRVRLDLLETRPKTLPSGGKNIFHSIFESTVKKPSIPLPPPPPPPEKKRVEPVVQVQTPATQVVEPTVLQRDMATFTFLGFLKKESKKTIFLSNGKEIFLVKKGDRVTAKYEVTALTDEAITISSINDGGEIVIPLIENRPLAAPRK